MTTQNYNSSDFDELKKINELLASEGIPLSEQIEGFAKYASRRALARFLFKYELFKKIVNVHGSIVECGVYNGAGLLAWAKLSSILEPVNYTRKIIGFDTFSGFPSVSSNDTDSGKANDLIVGGHSGSTKSNILEAVEIYDANRALSHIPKIELVEGDICVTAKSYLNNNPHLVVSLLYLDFDLYEPTKIAIQNFLPRMPKGSVICFDELSLELYPGETIAVHETMGINNLRLQRSYFEPRVSYAIIE